MTALIRGLYVSVMLLLRTHRGLWLALLSIITSMILLFSYLLLMRSEVITDELSGHGLVSSARLKLADGQLTARDANDIAKMVSHKAQALVLPIQTDDGLKCRFFTRTSYVKETKVMVDGYEEWIDKTHYNWVPNGEFAVVMNRIDMTVSRPEFVVYSGDKIIGRFEVLEFAESAVKLAIGQAAGSFNSETHYYLGYEPATKMKLGPLIFSQASGYFMLMDEEDLTEQQSHLLNNRQQVLNAFTNYLYRQHLPFLPGAAVDQLHLGDYEYSRKEVEHNNKMMLSALLYDHSKPVDVDYPARAFFSGALFNKLFPNPFDYKTLKIHCAKGDKTAIEEIVSIYGHYRLKPDVQLNPNQIYIAGGAEKAATVNGFVIKDLGKMSEAINNLTTLLALVDGLAKGQLNEVNQTLGSYSLFIFIIGATVMAMVAILMVLTLPFRRVMVHELFLIKHFDGHAILSVLICCGLIYLMALGTAWLLGIQVMDYVNQHILAPYNMPFMRFEPVFFISACVIVWMIWFAVWGWLCSGMAKQIRQYSA